MQKKNNNFVTGALIIAISNLLVKAIGAAYKIPLDRMILQPIGMGIYNSSYTIYNWLFVISTAGIPVAISKMVAESQAIGHYSESKKILKVSQYMLFIIGIISFAAMFIFARQFSTMIKAESAYLTMMVMSPSLFFVAIASSYRGFYQGQQNMFPTAISEVIEALSKLIFGICLSLLLKNLMSTPQLMHRFMSFWVPDAANNINPLTDSLHDISVAFKNAINFIPNVNLNIDLTETKVVQLFGSAIPAAGAIAGVSIGTLFSLTYLLIYNKIRIKKFRTEVYTAKVSSSVNILKRLIRIAVPITLGVSVFSLTSVIDTMTVMNLLYGLGYDEGVRSTMFGYLGRAVTLFGFPPTVIQAIAISVVPAIAAALAIKNKNEALTTAKSALRLTVLLAVPCAVILSGLSEGVLKLLYEDGNYNILLTIMGVAMLFVTIVQVCNAVLQAWGKVWIPVINMAVGGVVKIIINICLVSQPDININGAPIGTLCCYFTVMALNIWQLKKVSGIKLEIMDFVLKPMFTAALTLASSVFVYKLLDNNFPVIITLGSAIATAGIVYIISIFAVKAVRKEDILLLPKGNKLVKILEKYKVIR